MEVSNSTPIGPTGKLQNKVSMPYQFTIGQVISEGWQRVKGVKKTYWGAVLIWLSIYIALTAVGSLVLYLSTGSFNLDATNDKAEVLRAILNFIITLVTLPLPIGISVLAIYRSVNRPIRAKQIFAAYQFFWRLLLFTIILYAGLYLIFSVIMLALVYLAVHLGKLPGLHFLASLTSITALTMISALIAIYYFFSLTFASLLIVEKRFGVFQAIKTSFLAFKQHGFKIIATIFCLLIIIAISMIPFGLGLIWTLPLAYNSMGILYRIQFGVGKNF